MRDREGVKVHSQGKLGFKGEGKFCGGEELGDY